MGLLVEREWPVHMKKNVDGIIDTQYAHNKKELQAYTDLGYSDDLRSVHEALYPRLLYRIFNGNVETAQANDADHEAELAKDRYGRQPLKQPEPKATQSPVVTTETVDDSRVSALEEQVSEIRGDIKAILESLSAPPKNQKAPKNAEGDEKK